VSFAIFVTAPPSVPPVDPPPVVPPVIVVVPPPVVPPDDDVVPPDVKPLGNDAAGTEIPPVELDPPETPIFETGEMSAPGLMRLNPRIAILIKSIAVLINPRKAPTTFAMMFKTTLAMSPIMLKALPITVPMIGAAALITSKKAWNSSLFSITVAFDLVEEDQQSLHKHFRLSVCL